VTGGVLLAARLPWGVRALGLPLLLPVLLWQAPRPAPGEFELLAADVGQGNAVLVRTAGHALVYDAGPRFSAESDAGHRVWCRCWSGVDALVLSHRDTDHTGGARAVLAMQPQADLLSSIEDDHELQAPRAAMRCMAGQRWTWDGVTFEFLHPQAADYDSGARSNAMSCVLRIGNGRRTALLAAPSAQEARWWLRATACAPICCSCRTTAARPRPPPRFWMRCSRASCWSRPGTATASVTRRQACWSVTASARSASSSRLAVARPPGRPQARTRWPASAMWRGATGITLCAEPGLMLL
jgi:hypothetical protein